MYIRRVRHDCFKKKNIDIKCGTVNGEKSIQINQVEYNNKDE